VFEAGVNLIRGDEPSPTRSAVLTRLSHGHIRIGTFQRLAYFEEADNLTRLVRYCLEHLFGEDPAAGPERLFELVSAATARLAASYLAAGFVHGVLNTDNINVTGESFDYGPWRWAPTWDPGFTAAYFDDSGLYAFGRQPEAIQWNMAQLAGCLALIGDGTRLSDELQAWGERFHTALVTALLRRLGIAPLDQEQDRVLARAIVAALATREVGIDRFFFDWRGGRTAPASIDPAFAALRDLLANRARPLSHAYWSDPEPCSLLIDEVEAIWTAIAEQDDWARFEAKVAAIRRMGDALREDA